MKKTSNLLLLIIAILFSNVFEVAKILIFVDFSKGKFGAMMDVKLVNNGPVTIVLDSFNN